VTLSACQSGVNRILRSDEPMGLIRALLAVGARMVLATQWPVADLPTYLLMGRFYTTLVGTSEDGHHQGIASDPAAALGEAQQWLRGLTHEEAEASFTSFQQYSGFNQPIDIADDLPAGERPFAPPQYWASFTLYVG
jgi:CHAT domain-containing protein